MWKRMIIQRSIDKRPGDKRPGSLGTGPCFGLFCDRFVRLVARVPAAALALMVMAVLAIPAVSQSATAQSEDSEGDGILRKLDMHPIVFALVHRGRIDGRVTIELTLDAQSQDDMADIRLHEPQIRSDFVTALNGLARQRFRVTDPIDPDLVVAYLTPYLNRRLGHDRAAIYVQSALIEPL